MILKSNFQYFFLDLDDTLYEYEPCNKLGIQNFISYCQANLGISEVEALSQFQSARKIINQRLHGQAASHSRLLYAKEFCEKIGIDASNHAIAMESSYWEPFLNQMKLRENALEFLRLLKRNTKKIAIVTDLTTKVQLEKLKRLEINSFIDVIITSEEAGAEKPSTSIFQLAADKLEIVKDRTVMIGDNYEKDILGAQNFGISAFWYNETEITPNSISSFSKAIELFI